MRKSLIDTWEELEKWLTKQESNEIAGFCSQNTVQWPDVQPRGWRWPMYMELLCNAILEIKYFMSGIKTERVTINGVGTTDDVQATYEDIDSAEAYRRCIVGAVALKEIYGDHCYLGEVVGKIESEIMNKVKSEHSSRNGMFAECKNITDTEIMVGKALLGDKIRTWTNGKRKSKLGWRVGSELWKRMTQRCYQGNKGMGKPKHEATREENLQKNKATMVSFSGMKDDVNGKGPDSVSLADILTNDNYRLDTTTLENALQVAIKNGTVDPAKINVVVKRLEGEAKEKIWEVKERSKPCNSNELCSRLECVLRQKEGLDGSSVEKSTNEKKLWDEVQKEVTNLVTKVSDNGGTDTDAGSLCSTVQCPKDNADCVSKATCKIMVKALKEIHEMKEDESVSEGDRENDRIFKSTMRCVILNALAEKLKQHAKQGGYACAVEDGITKAFSAAKQESNRHTWCKKNDNKKGSCEPCEKVECISSKIGSTSLVSKVMGELNAESTTNVQTTLSNINDKATLCDRLQCAIDQWKKTTTAGQASGSSNEEFWKGNGGPVKELWDELAGEMNTKGKDGNETACNEVIGENNGTRTATPSEKAACNYLHAGFEQLYDLTAPTTSSSILNNPSFRQTMGCFLLHAYAQHMKRNAICDIEKGISKAFELGEELSSNGTNANCKGGKTCIPCKWADTAQLSSCQIEIKGTNAQSTTTEKVEEQLKTIVNDQDSNITQMLSKINKMSTLCEHMECIASHLNSTNGQNPSKTTASEFWTETGDVGKLWRELSNAMKGKENDNGNGVCDKMGENGTTERNATDPERRACQHLTAGFQKLKDITTNGTSSYETLRKDTSFGQAVGCFLLHSYAKHMQKESICDIENGIKKAFDTAEKGSNGLQCKWDDRDYDNCNITTNSNAQAKVTDKLTTVLPSDQDSTFTTTMDNINKTDSLCDQLKCAAPRWFQNNRQVNGNSGTTKKTWCDFWDGAVRTTLQAMFKHIDEKGKTETNAACNDFGDNNPDSVERKACNHITAGLQHINGITDNGNGNQLLERAVGCIALNMYVDEIIKLTEKNCPIDEERIKAMFEKWNAEHNSSSSCNGANKNGCFKCERVQNTEFSSCELSVSKTLINTSSSPSQPQSQSGACDKGEADAIKVQPQMESLLQTDSKRKDTLDEINKMDNFCTKMQCAVKQYVKKIKNGKPPSWDEITNVVDEELKALLKIITNDGNWKQEEFNQYCMEDIGSSWSTDTDGEKTAKQKACKLFASGLKHISDIKKNNQKDDHAVPLRKTMMCAALNLYADQLIEKSTNQCPLDNEKLGQAIKYAFDKNNATKNGANSCTTQGNNYCFECKRQSPFPNCQIGSKTTDKVKERMNELLEQNKSETKMDETLDKINSKDTFCTQVQCAIKQHYNKKRKEKTGAMVTPNWSDIHNDATTELADLLKDMNDPTKQKNVEQYCNDDSKWNTKGHKEKKTNKAACLHFAAGLKHIYGRGKGSAKVNVKDPSFGQTMGCLFLKEYTKQLKEMAKVKKQGNSWVHPLCDIDEGINHAFEQSEDIMKNVLSECNKGPNGISCFECKIDQDYDDCPIGNSQNDKIEEKVEPLLQEKSDLMEKTLENTVCPILLTDLLTPFLPLAPVSIGLSAMAYYLWKYFGPLGKGGARFRRSPGEIPGPSVQEQVLDHVQQDSSHEYQLVKERKPRSVPTRTKRSGRVNRRTIIEIHFEVLDECQKGDTQLNQKDFLELLVQEFMGSELMEEEQFSKEEVLMEGVPMESIPLEQVPMESIPLEQVPMESIPLEQVPMERVPSLGSGFMV
ncbi:SICAvar, type I [Plasmodium knowlesi strain H]|nr:SICAvar, type I [Plasmodium knowlesi strain H]